MDPVTQAHWQAENIKQTCINPGFAKARKILGYSISVSFFFSFFLFVSVSLSNKGYSIEIDETYVLDCISLSTGRSPITATWETANIRLDTLNPKGLFHVENSLTLV